MHSSVRDVQKNELTQKVTYDKSSETKVGLIARLRFRLYRPATSQPQSLDLLRWWKGVNNCSGVLYVMVYPTGHVGEDGARD